MADDKQSTVERMKSSLRSLASTAGKTVKEHPELLTAPAGALAGGYLANAATGNPLATVGGAAGGAGLAYALTDILKNTSPGVLSKDLKPDEPAGPLETFAQSPVMTTAGAGIKQIPNALALGAAGLGATTGAGYGVYRGREALERLGAITKAEHKKADSLKSLLKNIITGNRTVFDPIQEAVVNKPMAKYVDPTIAKTPASVQKVLTALANAVKVKV